MMAAGTKCGIWLRLTDQKARGSALEPWAALRAAPTSQNYVGSPGFEPGTFAMSMQRSRQLSYEPYSGSLTSFIISPRLDLRYVEPYKRRHRGGF